MKTLSKALNPAVNAETIEDIVFEGRNHEYGAYALRRNYNSRVNLSLLVVVSFAILITLAAYFWTLTQPPEAIPAPKEPTIVIINPGDVIPPPPSFKPDIPKEIGKVSLFNPPVIVEDVSNGGELAPMEDVLDNPSGEDPFNNQNGTTLLTYTVDHGGNSDGVEEKTFNEFEVNEQATFMGSGVNEFRKWLKENIIYPDLAMSTDIFGTVIIKFTIDKNGKVCDVEVQKGIHPLIDQASVDAILSSPKWRPAKINGNAVRISYVVPIKFSLIR